VLRSMTTDTVRDALYKDPDRTTELYQLCLDMKAARSYGDFELEERLHDELRDVFRNLTRLYSLTAHPTGTRGKAKKEQ